MLTPVVSKKQKKAAAASNRETAKNLILRRDMTSTPVPEPVKPEAPKPAPANTGGSQPFTPAELTQLDTMFDVVSWLVYLFAGNYEMMNQIGASIGFNTMDATQAAAARAKLQGKMGGLVERIEKMVNSAEPVEATAVSDIKNEIEAGV